MHPLKLSPGFGQGRQLSIPLLKFTLKCFPVFRSSLLCFWATPLYLVFFFQFSKLCTPPQLFIPRLIPSLSLSESSSDSGQTCALAHPLGVPEGQLQPRRGALFVSLCLQAQCRVKATYCSLSLTLQVRPFYK